MPPIESELQKTLIWYQTRRTVQQLDHEYREFGFPLIEELFAAAEKCREGVFTVLDQGCGTGRGLLTAVNMLRFYTGKQVRGIGVDINPIKDFHGHVEVIQAPAAEMPLPDASVDFGWSYATLIYIPDALRAIEEGHRVLKPGGTMAWECQHDFITLDPPFAEVLANTPGGDEFTYTKHPNQNGGLLVLRKPEVTAFRGFPYTFDHPVWPMAMQEKWEAWEGREKDVECPCFNCLAHQLPAFADTLEEHQKRRVYFRTGIYKPNPLAHE